MISILHRMKSCGIISHNHQKSYIGEDWDTGNERLKITRMADTVGDFRGCAVGWLYMAGDLAAAAIRIGYLGHSSVRIYGNRLCGRWYAGKSEGHGADDEG